MINIDRGDVCNRLNSQLPILYRGEIHLTNAFLTGSLSCIGRLRLDPLGQWNDLSPWRGAIRKLTVLPGELTHT